jgi:CDP-glucose 4,6-dehydratase
VEGVGLRAVSPPQRFVPDPAFWSGKRVFLTGHTGFKGSWLTVWLQHLGACVRGYSLPPDTTPSMFESLGLEAFCQHRVGDIRKPEHLRLSLHEFRPDIVLHLAAQPIVRISYEQPLATFETNVYGTAALLEACRTTQGIRAVVVVTSDKCYENREWEWAYREGDPLGGHDPYSASKAAAELVVGAYRRSFFSRTAATPSASASGAVSPAVASARAGNVFGGGDWCADRLIPDAVRAFAAGKPVIVRNPRSVRPWQHVLEPLAGYLMLARACYEQGSEFARAWNFGPPGDTLYCVEAVVERFVGAWGGNASCQLNPQPDAPHEAGLLLLDSGLANRALGWRPCLSLPEAISLTVEWYKTHSGGAKAEAMRQLTLVQIAQYQARIAKDP